MAKCETHHIQSLVSRATHDAARNPIEDGANENPADDSLVVQVRRLRPTFREVSQFALRRYRGEIVGQRANAFHWATIVTAALSRRNLLRSDRSASCNRRPRRIGRASCRERV